MKRQMFPMTHARPFPSKGLERLNPKPQTPNPKPHTLTPKPQTLIKRIGTHARRELYWQAYTKMSAKVSGMGGAAYCFLLYRADKDGDGKVMTRCSSRKSSQHSCVT